MDHPSWEHPYHLLHFQGSARLQLVCCGWRQEVWGPVSTVLQKETGLPSQARANSLLSPYLLCETELQLGAPSKESPGSRSKSPGGKSGLPQRAPGKAQEGVATAPSTRFFESTSRSPTPPKSPGSERTQCGSRDDSLRREVLRKPRKSQHRPQ